MPPIPGLTHTLSHACITSLPTSGAIRVPLDMLAAELASAGSGPWRGIPRDSSVVTVCHGDTRSTLAATLFREVPIPLLHHHHDLHASAGAVHTGAVAGGRHGGMGRLRISFPCAELLPFHYSQCGACACLPWRRWRASRGHRHTTRSALPTWVRHTTPHRHVRAASGHFSRVGQARAFFCCLE